MKNDIESHTLEIPCPHCGKKTSKSVRQLKAMDTLTCQSCGIVSQVDKTQVRREIAKLQSTVDAQVNKTEAELRRALSRLGK